MKILKRIKVPTGDICVVNGARGSLEFVSLADYGADVNLNQNKKVIDGLPLMPLQNKWVLTISTQYGCSMGCKFCDVPKVGPGLNATLEDMQKQINCGMSLHPEVRKCKRLNVHYARMGEPTWNPSVLEHARWMSKTIGEIHGVHPVVSTMMPKNNPWISVFLRDWMDIKNNCYRGEAGLQISINSTNERQRQHIFSGNSMSLREISELTADLRPHGRKITLNFPVCGLEINPKVLIHYFDPGMFVVKLTPMHKTKTALESGMNTPGDYTNPGAYEHIAENLRAAGFDVLVFIASEDEDEGMITCGNAVLSGREPSRQRVGEMIYRKRTI